MTIFNPPDLEELIAKRYVTRRKHPEADLWILNYTPKTQYERLWTPTTMQTRGLIVDKRGEVVSRPFQKFFNLGEYEGDLPRETFEVYDKVDGSLCISYFLDGVPYLATRGSFESTQAIRSNKLLRGYNYQALTPGLTYLFELITPENRIIVDYGQEEKLVLLAAIDAESGTEYTASEVGARLLLDFPIVEQLGHTTLEEITADQQSNREGFVIWWPQSGLRLKVKMEEYVRLHKLLFGLTERKL